MYVANTFRRMMAHATDELIGSIFWIPLFFKAWKQMSGGEGILLPWWLVIGAWVARLSYEIICMYVLQSLPAQHFLGLRVISTYHPELGLGWAQVVLRVLFAQFKYILGPAIYFMALFHPERQHLGDILSETRVVQLQERAFPPKNRYVLASILVYFSLIGHLEEVVHFVSDGRIEKAGVKVEAPAGF
jgi:uncharacterized RDD family membrane protein YckC